MKRIKNIVECIDSLKDLLKNVDLSDIYLDGLDSPSPYTEEDRVKEIIEYLLNRYLHRRN